MAKAPRPGTVKTRLAVDLGADAAARLYRAFLEDTLATAASLRPLRTDLDLLLCYAPPDAARELGFLSAYCSSFVPQPEGDLGSRLASVFGLLFAHGYAAVAAIGGDSPTLPIALLNDAFDSLERRDGAVLGPASDGGYYLVGLTRPEPLIFHDIPWSTSQVLTTTLDRARIANLDVTLLGEWYDVDEPDDLTRLTADLAANRALAPKTRCVLGTSQE